MVLKDLEIQNNNSQSVSSVDEGFSNDISLQAMITLACTSHLKKLEDAMAKEFPEIDKKQDSVRLYHQIQKAMDVATEANGELDAAKFDALIANLKDKLKSKLGESSEKLDPSNEKEIARLKEQFDRRMHILNEVGSMGSDMNKSGGKFSFEQRSRLLKNIENEIGDLNLQINMDLQKIKTYTDHHHQALQFANSIEKTRHGILTRNAREIAGRG